MRMGVNSRRTLLTILSRQPLLLLKALVHVLSKFKQRVCDVWAEHGLLGFAGAGVGQLQRIGILLLKLRLLLLLKGRGWLLLVSGLQLALEVWGSDAQDGGHIRRSGGQNIPRIMVEHAGLGLRTGS